LDCDMFIVILLFDIWKQPQQPLRRYKRYVYVCGTYAAQMNRACVKNSRNSGYLVTNRIFIGDLCYWL
jgi:hypothetical protein